AKVPEPEPAPKPEPPKAVVEAPPAPLPKPKQKPAKPEKKPPPPDLLASVLKTVEKLKSQPPSPAPETETKSDRPAPPSFDARAPITISQIDAIRRHFEKCWNIPAGAREAENLMVEVKVELDPDAYVQRAEIVDQTRTATDPFYRAAAESALRAVLNPVCRSLKEIALPPERYDEWKDMIISFNPKQMVGA
ncbi:MAG: energy transducer TonB, partial [Alphaproteobacteria bacterium]